MDIDYTWFKGAPDPALYREILGYLKDGNTSAIIQKNIELHQKVGTLTQKYELALETQRGLAADNVRLQEELREAKGYLQWCSASQDFQEGGLAREGWVRGPGTFLAPKMTDRQRQAYVEMSNIPALDPLRP